MCRYTITLPIVMLLGPLLQSLLCTAVMYSEDAAAVNM
jgi:hypothetical protein